MSSEGMLSIGDLAARAGVTVKTVRFYSDRGLLPEAARSGGGHRRYGPEAIERLRRIRSLRALGLPVAQVGRALERDGALEAAVDGRLRELADRMAALRWQQACLRVLRDGTAEERAERLRLLGALAWPPDTTELARFWRRALPARLPARLVRAVLDAAVPSLPEDPSPAQVLALARLHALLPGHRPAPLLSEAHRADVLYDGLVEAYALAATDLRGGGPPGTGAVDCFVAAYAGALGTRDAPAFRRRLGGLLTRSADPVYGRYWKLAPQLSGAADEPNPGIAHHWLSVAVSGAGAGV